MLIGIGSDGYIVFNEFGLLLVLWMWVKILVKEIVVVNVRFFGNDLFKVLIMVFIVGVGIVMDFREVCDLLFLLILFLIFWF